MALSEQVFDTRDQLNQTFAKEIAALLSAAIAEKGAATLLVSGGNTPKPLFACLSQIALDWSKVTISLVDERWVETSDDASNEKMLRAHLLQNYAAAANFIGLKHPPGDAEQAVGDCQQAYQAIKPADVLILGMGTDGHTASLFPCSSQLAAGLNLASGADFIATQPTTAPNQRMSMTLAAIVAARQVFLHLTGDDKKQVLEHALSKQDPLYMPIYAVAQQCTLQLRWAP